MDFNQFDTSGGGGGGSRGKVFARLLDNPENPLGWSLFMFVFKGITARIHLFTIVYIAIMLLWSIPKSNAGIAYMALAMASLFVIVLLHEFGHCFACRFSGGVADRIVMLPFGGLALIRPVQSWKSHLISTLGGPLVNVILLPLTCAALFFAGLGAHIVFNPFDPITVLASPEFSTSSTLGSLGLVGLWWFHYVNIVILGFNVLLPMYPFDGGRILQSALWARVGYRKSMEIAVNAGLVGAMVLAVIGLVGQETMIVAIALFGAWACWVERKRLRADVDLVMEQAGYGGGAEYGAAYDPSLEDEIDPKEARQQKQEADEQAELDRILAKISATGMDSLSNKERKILDRLSKKRRGE